MMLVRTKRGLRRPAEAPAVGRVSPCAPPLLANVARRARSDAPYLPEQTAAFTLLEILIAVSVFSIVLVAINGVFYGALRLRTRTVQAIEPLAAIEHAISIIKRDLNAVRPAGGILSGGLTTAITSGGMNQQGAGLEFYTASGLVTDTEPWGNVQKVALYLRTPMQRTTATGKELVRAVTRNLLATVQDQPEEQLLLENVEQVQFSLFDGSQWRQTWDASTTSTIGTNQATLPQAVQVFIQLAQDDKTNRLPVQFIVPITVNSTTNTSESTK
jgi:general secretion pathway protein J